MCSLEGGRSGVVGHGEPGWRTEGARLQRIGAVGRAARAVTARETLAQVAGRQRRGVEEAQVCAVGPRRRGQVHAGAQVCCGTGRARRRVAAAGVQAIGFEQYTGQLDALGKSSGRAPCTPLRRRDSCCSLRRGAGRGWRSSTAGRRRAGEGRSRVSGRVSAGAWVDHHYDAGGRVGAAGGGTLGK